MTDRDTGSILVPAGVAESASINLDREGNEIVVLARSRLLALLRELQQQTSEAVAKDSDADKERGIVNDVVNFLGDIVGRIRGRDNALPPRRPTGEQLQAELADQMRTLDLRIEQFIDLAALAGSPPEYAQELRQRSNAVSRLLGSRRVGSEMTAETFKELTRVLDLVQLTRRDVERRNLDNPRAAARFILARLPAGDDTALERVLSVPASTVKAWAASTETPRGRERARLLAVAQVIYDLWHSVTPEGLAMWFTKPFDEFNGRAPVELLDAAAEADIEALRSFARSSRGQVAT